ncbi:hypothetical protein CFP56_035456 [Quercus suber]|uniref:Disease resistance protein At4g27190-like leucine-rich repeats domain-containing protein n=1 Tax=Quercus suber TaxID=58331 RepID=A0AAW0JBC5_QUESU
MKSEIINSELISVLLASNQSIYTVNYRIGYCPKFTSKLDPLGFFAQCLHCVPRGKNYGPKVMSNQGTTNKSQENSSVYKEACIYELSQIFPMDPINASNGGTLNTLKDPRLCDTNDSPSKIWSLFPSHMIESLKNLESIDFYGCHSLEVIFELEESHMALVDQLRKLELC